MRRLLVLVPLLAGCTLVPDPFPRHPTFLPESCLFVVRQDGGFIRAGWETSGGRSCRPCVEGVVEVSEDDCGKVVVP